jgi:5-hydroxyisourate hydrolase
MMGRLTTHVLDTAWGRPAAGVAIGLWWLTVGGGRTLLTATRTNVEGRTDSPLLEGAAFRPGRYEIIFAVGAYFAAHGPPTNPRTPFLDEIPIRFGIVDATAHYHVPLLVSPWSYTTYRGS